MQITVLLFATLKDRAGSARVTLTLPDSGTTAAAVRTALSQQIPALATNLPTAVCAVNQEFASPETPVQPGDEVAFFTPVSGGSGYAELFRLSPEPFSTDELIASITSPDTGAVCVFSGMVRGATHTESGTEQTMRLEYEAYEPMALAKMAQVAAEIRERWPLVQGIAIVQRVGVLQVGQNTIAIACASGHRDQGCFESARYGIDRLKEIVPVWKKDVRPDGTNWIEGHYQPDDQDRRPDR
jgi:MoaE-MoaD fusion protein